MITLACRPSVVGQLVLGALALLCVLALAASHVDWRIGACVLLLIYGMIRREWTRLRLQHPRSVVELMQQAAHHWQIGYRSGEHVAVRWLPSSVITRYLLILHGVDAQQQRHVVLLFADSFPSMVWRRLVVAVRLGAMLTLPTPSPCE